MEQIQSLLDPVKDEDSRVKVLTNNLAKDAAIHIEPATEDEYTVSIEARQGKNPLEHKEDQKAIKNILEQVKQADDARLAQIAQQREAFKKKMAHPLLREDERTALEAQLEAFEKNLKDTLMTESDQQNSRLKSALEHRRMKRRDLFNQISEERQSKVLHTFQTRANNKVNMVLNQGAARDLALRLQNGFEKHEFMQVTENYLEAKGMREYTDLVNALFEERTRALRGYIFELMTQKQTEYRLLQEEFEPQRQFLRNKKAKGLLDEEKFKIVIDRLNDEQTEREHDVDLEYSEKEAALREELEKCRIDAECEQKKLLKDRQT